MGFWWGMGILWYFYPLCCIVQVFIYKQGDKKKVGKEGMPHFLNKKTLWVFFRYSWNSRYIPKRKRNLQCNTFPSFRNYATRMFLHEVWMCKYGYWFWKQYFINMKKVVINNTLSINIKINFYIRFMYTMYHTCISLNLII